MRLGLVVEELQLLACEYQTTNQTRNGNCIAEKNGAHVAIAFQFMLVRVLRCVVFGRARPGCDAGGICGAGSARPWSWSGNL